MNLITCLILCVISTNCIAMDSKLEAADSHKAEKDEYLERIHYRLQSKYPAAGWTRASLEEDESLEKLVPFAVKRADYELTRQLALVGAPLNNTFEDLYNKTPLAYVCNKHIC